MLFWQNFNLVGNHKGGIESNAELPNKLVTHIIGIFCGFGRFDKGLGSRAGNGSKRLNHFIWWQANAIIWQGDGFVLFIDGNGDFAIKGISGIASRHNVKFAFINCVWTIWDQLAEEDFFLWVKWIDHDAQNFPGISFKIECLNSHALLPWYHDKLWI